MARSYFQDAGGAVENGAAWLKANQNSSGSWRDPVGSEFRDTTVVVEALHSLGETGSEYNAALSFLTSASPPNNDYLARQITALARARLDVTHPISELLASQNAPDPYGINRPEGGWGIAPGYATDVLDTALALDALKAAGLAGSLSITQKSIDYLVAAQNPDGGWGISRGSESNLYLTARALLTLQDYSSFFDLQAAIDAGGQWLVNQQNAGEGWGSASSTVYETALVYYALEKIALMPNDSAGAFNYLLNSQSPDGSWNSAAYDTAVAILSLCPLEKDLDCDCHVDVEDIMLVANRWRCRSGDDCYGWRYDMDKDGDIDIVDIMKVVVHWGDTCGTGPQ